MAMDPPVRVLMVVEKLHGLGGAQVQAVRLARALRLEGIEARLVTGRWRRSEPRSLELEGIPVTAVFTALKMFHLKGLRKLGMYIYLASLLVHLLRKRRLYDVIHVHSATSSAFPVILAGRWLGKPTVMKLMASGEWGDLKRMRSGGELPGSSCMARFFRRADRVICLNAEAVAECRAEGFVPEHCISIPNGFPVKGIPLRTRSDTGGKVEVTFAGRLDPQKNPMLLLEAAAIVKQSPGGDGVRTRFLGDGPERRLLEDRARALGVEDRVRFLGRVTNVPVHLEETDIFVLPSLSEGISNALLEAMSHQVACIASGIPGNLDLIHDRVTGLVVRPDDAGGLARAILDLAGDGPLRERLGRAGRMLVEERFDIEVVARRYAELYRSLALPRSPALSRNWTGR
ncbi:MAG TPA: glycosyltransferase [Planctomycetota bacterium]|nr:glycosyltransferase [Planctomycetota bacterium]